MNIQEDTITAEELADEAVAEAEAPEPTKRTRKPKGEAATKAPKAPKEPKVKVEKPAKLIKVLVPAAKSGLREGTGRYQFLKAAESANTVADLIGKEFTVGDRTVKLTGANIQGMFSRGHVALSSDNGETWERVQTTVVSE